MNKEVLIVRAVDGKYALPLHISDTKELARVIDALKPLGYSFRYPTR